MLKSVIRLAGTAVGPAGARLLLLSEGDTCSVLLLDWDGRDDEERSVDNLFAAGVWMLLCY